jgi:predicted RNase H-like HicB family nuclease
MNPKGMVTMKCAYPTFIVETKQGDYLVYVPDMDLYTEGKSMADAIEMARDAIGLKGIDLEDDKKILPEASSYTDAIRKAQEDTEDIDFSSGTLTLVDVDFTVYRRRMDQRMVRRNVTLPNWLNLEADRLGLNVSRVLQDALADKVTQLR